MKRDMDLVRELLLHFEQKSETAGVHAADVQITGYTEDQIVLQLNIMAEAGLLVFEPSRAQLTRSRLSARSWLTSAGGDTNISKRSATQKLQKLLMNLAGERRLLTAH